MTTEIENLVDLALKEYEGPRLARIGAKIPRPVLRSLPVCYHVEPTQRNGRWTYRCWATDEDCEPLVGAAGDVLEAFADEPREAMGECEGWCEDAIEAICERYEQARDSSDEAMRATHPREA